MFELGTLVPKQHLRYFGKLWGYTTS
jgi:hypothetical protein